MWNSEKRSESEMRSRVLEKRLMAGVQNSSKAETSIRPSNRVSCSLRAMTKSSWSVLHALIASAKPESSKNKKRCGKAKYSRSNRYPSKPRGLAGSSASLSENPTRRMQEVGSDVTNLLRSLG